MSGSVVLIIDTNDTRRLNFEAVLKFVDYDPVAIDDPKSWRDQLKKKDDEALAVLLGDCGSDEQLLQTYYSLKEWDANIPVMLLRSAREKKIYPQELLTSILGYVEEPAKYRELTKILNQAQIYRESRTQSGANRSPELFRSLVGNSRGIRQVRKSIEQVADSDANVLILGESGTGKEVVARNLHYHSNRRENPFVPINCGAIPGDLLESELFGHEKGAFTGAITARRGRFELADGGTLFLDEIGDMSMHMQVKLLRVLQERTFERVGSNKSITVNVRIIAATHRNLEEAIKNGDFREDLFYRLNVFPIEMPPLRERAEDISLLISELITRLEHEKRGSVRLTSAAIMALSQYHWPGNVRELANLVERLVIMYPFGVVDVHDLPEKFRQNVGDLSKLKLENYEKPAVGSFDLSATPRLPREGLDLKEHLSNLEYNLIKQALEDAGGVVAHAATRLKLRRTTLVEKLRKYGLQRNEEAS